MILSNLSGQVTLTCRNNGMMAGDISHNQEIVYVDPGNAGENQVWDFSGIQYTGVVTVSDIQENPSVKFAEPAQKSMILRDEGYEYTYISAEEGYRETGYINNAKKLVLSYTNPVIRMQYPFSFGQYFSNPFAGVAWYNQSNKIDIEGVYSVTGDAFGTLILPDRILKNTLRVKTTRQFLQTSVCGSTQTKVVKYCWFAAGYRYPVLSVCTTENIYAGREPVTVKNAWVNLNQQPSGALSADTGLNPHGDTDGNTVIVFPNPFSEQVTYHYFLRSPVPVSVELYDMSGKFNMKVEKMQFQTEGLHTGTLNASVSGLPPGVYYLRFMFDKQILVTKIVKI